MKQIILILYLFASMQTTAQNFRTLTTDPTRDYEILHEDSTISFKGELHKIASDLMVENNDVHPAIHEIKFARAVLKSDTLNVLIFETNPSFRHEYWIKIVKDKYLIEYHPLVGGEAKRKIKAEGFGLILNSDDLSRGKELRGYTEYRGNCVKGCPREKLIRIKGNFKVQIE